MENEDWLYSDVIAPTKSTHTCVHEHAQQGTSFLTTRVRSLASLKHLQAATEQAPGQVHSRHAIFKEAHIHLYFKIHCVRGTQGIVPEVWQSLRSIDDKVQPGTPSKSECLGLPQPQQRPQATLPLVSEKPELLEAKPIPYQGLLTERHL